MDTRALTAFALLLASTAAADDAFVLVGEGDILPNGDTVLDVQFFDVEDDGTWAAVVTTDRPGLLIGNGEVLLVDGQPVLATGDVVNTGDTVAWIRKPHLEPGGSLCARLEVLPPGAVNTTQAVWVDGTVQIATGPVAGLAPGTEIEQIAEVARAGSSILAWVDLLPSGNNAVVRYDYTPGSVTISLLAETGSVLAPLTWPLQAPNGLELASDGAAGIVAYMLDGATARFGVWNDGIALFEEGQPAPLPGHEWAPGGFPSLSCASGGQWATATKVVDTATLATTSVLVRDGAVVHAEGDPVPGAPAATFGAFDRTGVALSDAGVLWATLPLANPAGVVLLMREGEVVLRPNASSASGQLVTAIDDDHRAVVTSPDGRRCLTRVTLAGGLEALVSVERGIGRPSVCSAVANSTGVEGKLRMHGSSYLAANDLSVEAFDLPLGAPALLLTSTQSGFVAGPGGSSGNLCLGGAVGRFVGQIQNSGATGSVQISVDLLGLPQPTGAVAAAVGETWLFQAWHRDSAGGGGLTTNFTRARGVTFR